MSVVQDDATDHAQINAELPVPAGTKRRNLRTRNEKQLHPYMFDKAQYQQQCRERGMRPVRVTEAAQQAAAADESSASDDEEEEGQVQAAPLKKPEPKFKVKLSCLIAVSCRVVVS